MKLFQLQLWCQIQLHKVADLALHATRSGKFVSGESKTISSR